MPLGIVSSLLHLFVSIYTFYVVFKVSDKIKANYKFDKDFFDKNVVMIHLPKELLVESKSINFDRINENKFKDTITYFCVVLTNHFDRDTLNCFYQNINSLIVKDNIDSLDDLLNLTDTLGIYYNQDNSIKLYKKNKRATLYHELFHMASSYVDNNNMFSGFSYSNQNDDSKDFGDGLNEGYTDLLTKRYFGNVEVFESDYDFEILIASFIEEIVGKDVMEKLYLTADFQGLMGILKRYAYEDEIRIFIKDLDFVLKYNDEDKLNKKNIKILNEVIKNISEFLVRTNYRKVSMMDVSDDVKKRLINSFNRKIDKHPGLLLSLDGANKIIEKEIERNKLINGYYSR